MPQSEYELAKANWIEQLDHPSLALVYNAVFHYIESVKKRHDFLFHPETPEYPEVFGCALIGQEQAKWLNYFKLRLQLRMDQVEGKNIEQKTKELEEFLSNNPSIFIPRLTLKLSEEPEADEE